MTNEEFFKEIDFIREKIWDASSALCDNKVSAASFMLGNIYAECRNICLRVKKEIKENADDR